MGKFDFLNGNLEEILERHRNNMNCGIYKKMFLGGIVSDNTNKTFPHSEPCLEMELKNGKYVHSRTFSETKILPKYSTVLEGDKILPEEIEKNQTLKDIRKWERIIDSQKEAWRVSMMRGQMENMLKNWQPKPLTL